MRVNRWVTGTVVAAAWIFGCGGDEVSKDTGSSMTGTSSSTTTATSTGDCQSWLLTYDLTGSKLNIDADMASFEITLQEPYGDELNMGPGYLMLRAPDVGGAPGLGEISILELRLTENFATGVEGFAMVYTDLEIDAGPDVCGLVSGQGSAGEGTQPATIAWAESALPDYCQTGTVSCIGLLCGSMGAPPEDDPIVYDEECSTLPLASFEVEPDLSTIGMPPVVVRKEAGTTTTVALSGTLIDATLDAKPPKCICP
jgi:hypothetical protein